MDLASIYLMRNIPEMRSSFFMRAKKLFDPPAREVQSKYLAGSQSQYTRKDSTPGSKSTADQVINEQKLQRGYVSMVENKYVARIMEANDMELI